MPAQPVSTDRVRLTRRRRKTLTRISRQTSGQFRQVQRARILLAAAQRIPSVQIARQVGCTAATVRKTRRDYRARGMRALTDRPRPGRPPVYDIDVHLLIIATATSEPPETDAQWTHTLIAGHLRRHHAIGISPSQIGRILAAVDIRPHRVKGWLNRPDNPDFFHRAEQICALYQRIPAGTVLLSVDEKTGIQARSRKHRTRRAGHRRPERREFEYRRHGTVSLMAALDVADGTVRPAIIGRNTSQTFQTFLTEIDLETPAHLNIHLILDNGASHTAKATRAWLAAHPRFSVTYTPKHASWLNMIELVFSILTRRLLRRGEFTSREHLANKILKFFTHYNRTAKPFRWTYDGHPLKAA
ncbi:IS630 family transposase [Actinoplanes sp. NBRC 101535]|uniref:IS630 family transposase n=1 Tax=Actinoplanes sp. NBRC 101535 TaxID=3032196 RepID=UPI0024A1F38A|nr:IS630 family transposase [Actinoplanes sp. NBRC 101535]GLY08490.1 IS630 family transposase [Actinoplanes sp. NBRC 101535]